MNNIVFLQYLNRPKINPVISLFSFLLAAVAHSRCTSLVCSCYVTARNSDSKDEESIRSSSTSRKQFLASNIDGFLEGRFFSDKSRSHQLINSSSTIGGFNGESSSGSKSNISTNCIEPMPALKSTLKKSTSLEIDQLRMETRKVNWPDALGKDIAHIREFEPSVSEDGELESVRNSCVCVIQ